MSQSDVQRTIRVRGTGSVAVTPDTANASIGVVITDHSVRAAQRQVDQRMNAVIAVIKNSGIPAERIKTTDYSVDVMRDHQARNRPIVGYSVSHIVRISVGPSKDVGDVISAAVDAGANSVDNIHFTTGDPSTAIQQARSLAMADALSRAQQLAAEANLELGDPITIVEGQEPGPVASYGMVMESRSYAPPSIEVGQQEIEMTVSVVYEARSKSA